MTDEQINIAIAEACGWHDLSIVDKTACGLKQKVTSLNGRYGPIPDHVNDLNAMHEVEEMLSEDERQNYWIELYGFAPRRVFSTHKDNWQMIHPTARQRAEAFLKTIGKWEEVQP